MMDLNTIRAMSRDAAIEAARKNQVPFVVLAEDLEDWRRAKTFSAAVKFPFLGDYIPKGWRRTDREPLFVDSSGFGSSNEPAMNTQQFIAALCAGKGYAVIEAGQFQVYIGEYEIDDKSKGNRKKFANKHTQSELEDYGDIY